MELRALAKAGHSIREISRLTGISRTTVAKYVRGEAKIVNWGPRAARPTKLDPYKGYLLERISHEEAGKRIPCTVYFREIKAMGYPGGETQMREWLNGQRTVVAQPDLLVRFETKPGEQVQIDWAVIRRGDDPLSAFVATLGYSRWSYVWFTRDEKLATLLDCHERLFEALGGVPAFGLYDNPRTIVSKRDAYGPGLHKFQPEFLSFVGHHGLTPKLCRPFRAKTKGKVERFIRYLKQSFVWPLESKLKAAGLSLDAATANVEVGQWLREVANVRIHSETQQVPAHAIGKDRAALLPYKGSCLVPSAGASAATAATPLPSIDLEGSSTLKNAAQASKKQRTRAQWGGYDLIVPQHDLSVYEEVRV